jgi:hypothetical protein
MKLQRFRRFKADPSGFGRVSRVGLGLDTVDPRSDEPVDREHAPQAEADEVMNYRRVGRLAPDDVAPRRA